MDDEGCRRLPARPQLGRGSRTAVSTTSARQAKGCETPSRSSAGRARGRDGSTGPRTLDEVQDFESQIRELFRRTGFMLLPDDVFMSGRAINRSAIRKPGWHPGAGHAGRGVRRLARSREPEPLSEPRTGRSPLTASAGKALFERAGLRLLPRRDRAHGQRAGPDDARRRHHHAGCRRRARGGPLGFDTPTLLGVWETARLPARRLEQATLRDVLATKNLNDLHGSGRCRALLGRRSMSWSTSTSMQIDDELPVHALPFSRPGR